ncbi:hypothetical protein [Parasphingorhabdus sp.]|uniref:hypothetical protein n=1 Tax=Parasphingorhabdus sp. TaxID=2709688 RepID=UPI00326607ED
MPALLATMDALIIPLALLAGPVASDLPAKPKARSTAVVSAQIIRGETIRFENHENLPVLLQANSGSPKLLLPSARDRSRSVGKDRPDRLLVEFY